MNKSSLLFIILGLALISAGSGSIGCGNTRDLSTDFSIESKIQIGLRWNSEEGAK